MKRRSRLLANCSPPPDSSVDDKSAVASLCLVFWNVADVALNGALVDRAINLELTRIDDEHIAIAANAADYTLSAVCRTFEILSFGVYSDLSVQRNRKTLFTYPNVWNSCLIRLRNAGYELELFGDPDPAGYASHCRWHATQDGVVLKAGNPIELLGLTELHRNAPKPIRDTYWWRVDGPSIVSELEDAWWRKWHGDKSHD